MGVDGGITVDTLWTAGKSLDHAYAAERAAQELAVRSDTSRFLAKAVLLDTPREYIVRDFLSRVRSEVAV